MEKRGEGEERVKGGVYRGSRRGRAVGRLKGDYFYFEDSLSGLIKLESKIAPSAL